MEFVVCPVRLFATDLDSGALAYQEDDYQDECFAVFLTLDQARLEAGHRDEERRVEQEKI